MRSTYSPSSNHRLVRLSDVSPCESCPQAPQCVLPPVRQQSAAAFRPLLAMEPGETLFHSGEPFRHLYAIRHGILVRWEQADEWQPTVVGFYLPGEIAGLGGFAEGYYRFTVVTVQPTVACPVDPEAITTSESPLGMRALRRAMAWQSRVDACQHRYLKLADAARRVAGCLHALRQRRERVVLPPTENLCIPIPLIASHLGLDAATVRALVAHDTADQVAL